MPKVCTAYNGSTFGSYASAASGGVPGGFARTDTASVTAGSGNSFDTGGTASDGCRLSVNLTALSGTSPTIQFALYDSADNVTFAAVPGMTAGPLSATGTSATTTSIHVRRYVAIQTTVTGTTPSATFTATVEKGIPVFTPAQNPDHTAVKDTRT